MHAPRSKSLVQRESIFFQIATTPCQDTGENAAPPTCLREAALKAEEEAVDAAEEVEGVVDDARVKEPDPVTDLEARLANEGSQKEGLGLTRTGNQTTQTQSH